MIWGSSEWSPSWLPDKALVQRANLDRHALTYKAATVCHYTRAREVHTQLFVRCTYCVCQTHGYDGSVRQYIVVMVLVPSTMAVILIVSDATFIASHRIAPSLV